MTDVEMWALLVGALLPPLISIIQQPRWPDWFRAVVTVVTCVVAAAVELWLVGNFELGDKLVHSILLTLVAAWAAYGRFWKPTGIAQTIEDKTAVGAAQPSSERQRY